MPSYDQLDNEPAWRAETAPPALRRLATQLESFWGDQAQTWIRGDNEHLRGYHRSRRWIKESAFCTNHSYSVTRTPGDRSGGDSNWCCALDISLPQALLSVVCRRLDQAVRARRLEKITEWYGNLGGDQRADGWDNISKIPANSDSSHLSHLHLSFDRGRANEDHRDVFEILTGEDMGEYSEPFASGRDPDGKQRAPIQWDRDVDHALIWGTSAWGENGPLPGVPTPWIVRVLDELHDKVDELSIPAPAPVDPVVLEAVVERVVRRVLGSLDGATALTQDGH